MTEDEDVVRIDIYQRLAQMIDTIKPGGKIESVLLSDKPGGANVKFDNDPTWYMIDARTK